MWWFIFLCDLLIPVIMIIVGIALLKSPPKKINKWSGYRSALSMKNMDTWRCAHKICGGIMRRVGSIILLPSALVHIPFYNSDEGLLGVVSIVIVVIQCAILIASVICTEIDLNKYFNEDGTRK